MLWSKWYQTVFFFLILNILILGINLQFHFSVFVVIYSMLIVLYVYIEFYISNTEVKKDEFIEDDIDEFNKLKGN